MYLNSPPYSKLHDNTFLYGNEVSTGSVESPSTPPSIQASPSGVVGQSTTQMNLAGQQTPLPARVDCRGSETMAEWNDQATILLESSPDSECNDACMCMCARTRVAHIRARARV